MARISISGGDQVDGSSTRFDITWAH